MNNNFIEVLAMNAVEMTNKDNMNARIFNVDFKDSYSPDTKKLAVRCNDFIQCKIMINYWTGFLNDIHAKDRTKQELIELLEKNGVRSFALTCKKQAELLFNSGELWDRIKTTYPNPEFVFRGQCSRIWNQLEVFFRHLAADIAETEFELPLRSTLLGDPDDEFHDPYTNCPDTNDSISMNKVYLFLMFCQFGNRFVYMDDDLSKATIKNWLNVNYNGYESNIPKRGLYRIVTSIMKRINTAIWNIYKDLDINKCVYTGPGRSLEGKLTVAEKYVVAASYYDDGFNMTFSKSNDIPTIRVSETTWWRTLVHDVGLRFRTAYMSTPWPYNGGPKDRDVRYNRMSCVPKNSTSGRLVAPESVYHINNGRNISQWLEAVVGELSSTITSKTQDVNRWMASYIPQDTDQFCWATIDSTSSSDTIYLSVVKDATPDEMFDFLTKYRSEYSKINARTIVKLNCLYTMGCPECFSFQLYWYTIVAITALYLVEWFANTEEHAASFAIFDANDEAVIDLCRVYAERIGDFGDDLIVPDECYDTVVGVLQALGQIPNTKKSYSRNRNLIFSLDDGRTFESFDFRESCGANFLHPFNSDESNLNNHGLVKLVTPIFYPRGGFSFNDESGSAISSLIALQHRVCQVFPTFNNFIKSLIRQFIPGITSSFIGSKYNDLWEDVEVTVRTGIPFAESPVHMGYFETDTNLINLGYRFPKSWIERDHTDSHGLVWDVSHRDHMSIVLEGKIEAQSEIVDLYLYYIFLENGPIYQSPLDQLLGISTQRSREDAAKLMSKADFKIIRTD